MIFPFPPIFLTDYVNNCTYYNNDKRRLIKHLQGHTVKYFASYILRIMLKITIFHSFDFSPLTLMAGRSCEWPSSD